MSRPRGIAINEGRKIIYIVDYMRHTILVYDLAGKYLFEFGGRGSGPLWFNFPNSITVDRKGRLIVADLFNNRVQILKTEFSQTFTGSKGLKTDTPATVTPGASPAITPTTIMPGTPQTVTPIPVTPSTRQTFTPTTVTASPPQTGKPAPEAISPPPNSVEVEIGTTSDPHIEDWR
jgi:DNA-binding beta-propeller fold protein YncE